MDKKAGKIKKNKGAWVRRGLLAALVLLSAALLVIPGGSFPSRDNSSAKPTPVAPAASDMPRDRRDDREEAYDKDVATLQKLVDDDGATEQTRAQAGERLARMVADHQCELGIETALLEAGFTPCFVLMQNGSLTVMVGEHELTAAQSVTILSVCVAHAEIDAENVRIMTGQAL